MRSNTAHLWQIGSPPNKKLQGLSIISNGCAERHSLLNMSSYTTLVQQAEAGGWNEKNLHKRSAGIRSVASNEPFFGTDTRWEPVLNQFCLTRHFTLPEPVPHCLFSFHAEALHRYCNSQTKSIECMPIKSFLSFFD